MTQPDPTAIIHTAQSQNRHLLTEVESKALLSAAGLDVVRTELAQTRDQAVSLAEDLGWPVALKVCSPDIVHKSDIGGVRLNLGSADAVGQAFDDGVLGCAW
jgi:acetyltransferase